MKANFDFLTMHRLDKSTPFVKRHAAINLLKAASAVGAILVTADAVLPGSVDWNPTSSDFGKIKVGDTRFDVTGGMGSLVILGQRLASVFTGTGVKSSSSGKITSLTSGEFGQPTAIDEIVNFFGNKLSPAGAVVKDLLKGKDFTGNKPTIVGELGNLFVPMPITQAIETANTPNSADALLATIADALGVSVFGWKAQFPGQHVVGTGADFDFPLPGVGLPLLVESHDDHRSPVAPRELRLPPEGLLALLQADRIDHGLALYAFEAGLDDRPFRGIDHDRNAADIGL